MNAYQVLGILKTATPSEVKKAYRKMSQKWHPDRNKANDAEAQFKIIQEAYEFIQTGKSMTGLFLRKKPAPVPKPKPKETEFGPGPSPEYHAAYHESFVIPTLVVKVSFNEVFNGGIYRIPQSEMIAKIPRGVYNGLIERQKCFSPNLTQSMVFDIQYEVIDPTGFYSIQTVGTQPTLYCEYPASIAAILAEMEVSIRNADHNLSDITFKLSAKTFIDVPHAGLPTKTGREKLVVKVLPRYDNIDDTPDGVLMKLRQRIDKRLDRNRRSYY